MLEIKEFRQIKEFKCYETKIEESEKAGRHRELIEPRTPLAWATIVLSLSYDSRTTTNPHNPCHILLFSPHNISIPLIYTNF